jgi:CRP-like cAMP-binding protein
MHNFTKYMSSVMNLNELESSQINNLVRNVSYKKGEIITHEGDISKNMMFLKYGIVRSYFIDIDGRDFTWGIYYAGKQARMKNLFVVDYASFISQEPSKLIIEVIKDSQLDSVNYHDLMNLFDSSAKWQRIGRLMADKAYNIVHNRVISLLTEKADVRYNNLLEENAELLEIVPQYVIASYLGIKPQSLSRIKAL